MFKTGDIIRRHPDHVTSWWMTICPKNKEIKVFSVCDDSFNKGKIRFYSEDGRLCTSSAHKFIPSKFMEHRQRLLDA